MQITVLLSDWAARWVNRKTVTSQLTPFHQRSRSLDLCNSAGNVNLNSTSSSVRPIHRFIMLTTFSSTDRHHFLLSKERNWWLSSAHKVFLPAHSRDASQATVRLLLPVWLMGRMYHMMHSNQGNQEIKVLHGERKGNLHLHIQLEPLRFGLCSLQPCGF